MKSIANLLFEMRMLKDIVRSGYSFLGSGRETIAEHCFTMAFICFVMSRLDTDIDGSKLMAMALLHDIPEARTGDLNYVQKKYTHVDEAKAISDLINPLSFGNDIKSLIEEFNLGETREAKLAKDADQLSFVLELKKLEDTGAVSPEKWLPLVIGRIETSMGKQIAQGIMETQWDEWWTNDYSEK
ncbi:MAG: HD domain-containing protein [Proteobacteria bacterium]|nr:HD domain-containing protein [Desulfobacula sp.]MBU3952486.1 HD domain-containing protein [Pseudomonadota bacterium]MBU4129504.1 HD domain-containing protein [Pseudomonadota bacterium]